MVSVRLDKEMELALNELVKKKGVSKSALIKEALKEFLAKEHKEQRLQRLKRLSQKVSHVEGKKILKLEDEMNSDLF